MADYRANIHMLPQHMQEGMLEYVEHGIPTGGFLKAILCNDLKGAFRQADIENQSRIKDFVEFIYWHLPSNCQGSVETYEHWCKIGGLQGLVSEAPST